MPPPALQPVTAAPQIQYVSYQINGPTTTTQRQDGGLGSTVRTMGIVALSFMLVGFIPCLGWLNYLNIFLSFITIILVALVSFAIVLGTGRLIIGGGCI
jgi:hypothetical protein